MKAYSQGITKEQFVNETKKHRDADAFLRQTYGQSEGQQFRGCAVGCAIDSINRIKGLKLDTSEHEYFETHLGVPKWLARLEDTLFENISESRHKDWPVQFAEAINQNSDLDKIKVPFIVYLMECNLESVRSVKYDVEVNPGVKSAIDQTEAAILQMIEAQKSGDQGLIDKARSAARSAAGSAARSAAGSAAESAARSAAWSAAESAESAARSAAESAESAARSAAESAESAARSAARSAAESAARSAAFDKHADKLLELMRECKL